ncbi:endonuclease/exonuclease/phosphatase family protein [Luteimonas sp. RD2P54]|uniref:Endonuclease/exonuclease/phosphatase family protein n=1 Tax=Luteimonas endophytica TaxID=3042023 RepID=A0ABT6JAW8_9GAMM|nr:endonuclease/exonuclease/phosphatase family protein [Luteimonas endophytica]MDH5823956.1 endonuclease/exonuclease/phosphatase family protein [Luteimonas endophytica]
MSSWIFAGLTLLLALAALLPLLHARAWWIRGFDFPRLQLFVLSAAVLAVQLAVREFEAPTAWAVVAVNAAIMLYQGWWIWPYTRLHPVEARACTEPGHARIRLMTSNVLMTNRDAAPLLRLVRELKPDILVAVETDAWWERQLDALLDQLPHSLRRPLDNLYGMHVYSRLPLEDGEIRFLVEDDIPSAHAVVRLADGQRVAVHCLHPRPPSPTEADGSAERDAELVVVGRAAAASRLPAIVTGDLNDVAWSRTTRLFRRVSGLLDPRVGRGMYNTFHARLPALRWPLDHLFHCRHFTLVEMRRLPDIGSDHFPILVELALDPGENPPDAGLELDGEAREEARDAIEDADADDVAREPVRRD